MNDYTALQVKTSYSILDSLNDIKKLVNKAYNYGYKALAITDESNMFGVMEFYQECKKYNIKEALNNKVVTMAELESNGFKPLKEEKNLQKY